MVSATQLHSLTPFLHLASPAYVEPAADQDPGEGGKARVKIPQEKHLCAYKAVFVVAGKHPLYTPWSLFSLLW